MNWVLVILMSSQSGVFATYIPMQSENVCIVAKNEMSKNSIYGKISYTCIRSRY